MDHRADEDTAGDTYIKYSDDVIWKSSGIIKKSQHGVEASWGPKIYF